jgi:hypothetical protein
VARYSHEALEAVSGWAFPQDRNKYLVRVQVGNSRNNSVPTPLDKAITAALNHALDALAGLKDGWKDLLTIVGLPTQIGPHDAAMPTPEGLLANERSLFRRWTMTCDAAEVTI